jgi:hypothetical protein
MTETIKPDYDDWTMEDMCPDCGGPIMVRNPSGHCDHLYYPDYKSSKDTTEAIKKYDKEIYGI